MQGMQESEVVAENHESNLLHDGNPLRFNVLAECSDDRILPFREYMAKFCLAVTGKESA